MGATWYSSNYMCSEMYCRVLFLVYAALTLLVGEEYGWLIPALYTSIIWGAGVEEYRLLQATTVCWYYLGNGTTWIM